MWPSVELEKERKGVLFVRKYRNRRHYSVQVDRPQKVTSVKPICRLIEAPCSSRSSTAQYDSGHRPRQGTRGIIKLILFGFVPPVDSIGGSLI